MSDRQIIKFHNEKKNHANSYFYVIELEFEIKNIQCE